MVLAELRLKKPRLLQTPYDFYLAAVLLLTLLSFSLSLSYQKYLDLKRFDFHEITATLISQQKHMTQKAQPKPYFSLQLQHPDFNFRTLSFLPLKELTGRSLTLSINTRNIDFLEYLKGFYAYSYLSGVSPTLDTRFHMIEALHLQHEEPLIANLYGALFLVESIAPELRQKLTALGINHLAALSGFHLGFLSLIVLLLLRLIYAPLHQRFFPYRHARRDIMIVTLLLLFTYTAFLDFTPSLMRALGMLVIGFYLYDRGFKLLSFTNLFITVLLLCALVPALLFSLGFWLSVYGVFLLFIVLKHFPNMPAAQLFVWINLTLFLLMLPAVLFIFEGFSWGQIFSPLLSMLFTIFYPLSLLLHAVGMADLLDTALVLLFSLKLPTVQVTLTGTELLLYFGLLLGSLRSKFLFFALLFYTLFILIQTLKYSGGF